MVRETSPGTCALCGKKAKLLNGHLVPKFVGKWLKSTSATGFMSRAEDLGKRVQDLPTMPMLCSECEQKFSRLESYFVRTVFKPFHQDHKRRFEYDERLERFALSLSWRTLKASYDDFKEDAPELVKPVDSADADWKRFLDGRGTQVNSYESHLFFLDYVKEGDAAPTGINWYTLRTVDATLVEGIGRIFTYTKLPWMVFVTAIIPRQMDGWHETLIRRSGVISSPQEVTDREFGSLIIERAKLSVSGKLPEGRVEAIRKALLKNPDKYLESASLEVRMAEQDRALERKMAGKPDFVRALFTDVIAKAVDESGMTKADNQLAKLGARRIAEKLADLSPSEASNLDMEIRGTIREAAEEHRESKRIVKCSTLWVLFMVNPHSTRAYQRARIAAEAERMKAMQSNTSRVPFAIFAMNVEEAGASYESGFWFWPEARPSV